MKRTIIFPLTLLTLLITACNEKDADTSNESTTTSALDSFYTDEAPDGAKQISEVFSDPTPGQEIVLAGEIMGRMQPFIDGRAMVVLGDPTKITPCNRIPGDECPTPMGIGLVLQRPLWKPPRHSSLLAAFFVSQCRHQVTTTVVDVSKYLLRTKIMDGLRLEVTWLGNNVVKCSVRPLP